MAVELKDLVGTHVLEAFWEGTKLEYFHRACNETCGWFDPYPSTGQPKCQWTERFWRAGGGREQLRCAVVRMDGLPYMFNVDAISTIHPRDRSTMLSTIHTLDKPARELIEITPCVVEVRIHKTDDLELLYATSEATGKCMFEIGTEFDTFVDHGLRFTSDHCWFRCRMEAEGFDVPWLDPIDDNPPVEIKARQSRVYSTPKKVIGGYRGGKVGAATPAPSTRPSAERRRIEKAAYIAKWRRERGE